MSISNITLAQNKQASKQTEKYLLNSNSSPEWRVVNDVVMGGRSSSNLTGYPDTEYLTFKGEISLENNGGFASIRSPKSDYDFSKYKAVQIKVRGDGKQYGFSLSEDNYFTGFYYHQTFSTRQSEWTVITLPFSDFRPKYFGRTFDYKRKVDLTSIKEVSLLIAGKQQGWFKLEIEWIKLAH